MQPPDFIFDNPGWRKRHFLQDSCKKRIALKDSSNKLISWKILVSILKEMHCLEGSWKKSIDLQDSCKKSIFFRQILQDSRKICILSQLRVESELFHAFLEKYATGSNVEFLYNLWSPSISIVFLKKKTERLCNSRPFSSQPIPPKKKRS